jgi:hypothetical protein
VQNRFESVKRAALYYARRKVEQFNVQSLKNSSRFVRRTKKDECPFFVARNHTLVNIRDVEAQGNFQRRSTNFDSWN